MTTVLAVIVTFNGVPWIRKSIGTLVADQSVPMDILVVDNASTDETRSVVECNYPNANFISLAGNVGFGRANNIGFEYALKNNYEYVWLINQDAWIDRGCMADLIDIHSKHTTFGILSGIHMNGTGKELDYYFAKHVSATSCGGLFADLLLDSVKEVYEVSFVNAAAWLLPTACLAAVGGFDPLFPHYGEDCDYAYRALRRGFKIGVTPFVRVIHDRPQNRWNTNKVETDIEYIMYLVHLKRADVSVALGIASVVKELIDRIGTHLLFRDWRKARDLTSVLVRVLGAIPKVQNSRNEMRTVCRPYLANT